MTKMVRNWPNTEEVSSSEERPPSTNFVSRDRLCRRLHRGADVRANFVESHINKGVAYQLRAMREQRGWSQDEVASMVDMPQTAISRLESPNYGKATITTLKRMAKIYDVALVVRFVPFSKLANWVSGNPFLENGLSSDAMAVPSFDEETRNGMLDTVSNTAVPMLRSELSAVSSIVCASQAVFTAMDPQQGIDIAWWNSIKSEPMYGNFGLQTTNSAIVNPLQAFPPFKNNTPQSNELIRYQRLEPERTYAT